MIKEIYQGDFRPSDNMGETEEYRSRRQHVYELSTEFQKRLDVDNQATFNKLMDAHLELLVTALEEGYIAGFKDGVRLMVEVMGSV